MKEKLKNNKELLIVMLLLLISIVTASYAWFRLTKTSNTVNKITMGGLDLVLDEEESITLKNEVPRSYKQGMKTKEYTFTLTNRGSDSNYKLSLADLEKYTDEDGNEIVVADENRLDDSKIRYILLKDGEVATADKSKILTDRTIDTGTIKKEQTISYSLRVWIDSRAGDNNTESEIMEKIFNVRLSLVAEQTIAKEETEEKPLPTPVSFSTDSWETIQAIVKAGKGSFYNVGDTREVDMGSFRKRILRLANTTPCTNGETSETACGFVVEFANIITKHNMNTAETSLGGWKSSELRTYINETIYNELPSDLKQVITPTKVVSSHGTLDQENFVSTDNLYLLSPKEVFNSDIETASSATRQLDYYKKIGVTSTNYSGAAKNYGNSAYAWWLRSADQTGKYYFYYILIKGDVRVTFSENTRGISPAFRIA